MTSKFFVQCIIKQLLHSVLVISRIIKVSVRVISLSLRLRLITLTSTLIILDITKTSSNNCLIKVQQTYLCQKTSNIYSYNSRSTMSGKFYIETSRLEIENKSFSRLGLRLWNKIPRYITNLPKKAFRRGRFSANCYSIY